VLDYNEASQKYLVEFMENGNQKNVYRLSLMLNSDNVNEFHRRYNDCRLRLETASDEIRFLKYIES
jgi:hypothetical protein